MSTQSNKNIEIKSIIDSTGLFPTNTPIIKPIEPPFKWIGGKRRFIKEITKLMPNNYTIFYELFFGAGALSFSLQPKNLIINDFNPELINFYQVVKNNVDDLIDILKTYSISKEFFYSLRNLDRDKEQFDKLTNIERAARIFYLIIYNFNSSLESNLKGQISISPSPKCLKNIKLENQFKKIQNISDYLKLNNVTILNKDCNDILKNITDKNCFIYLDPPYYLINKKSRNGKNAYYGNIFDESDQIKLKESCDSLTKRGIKFLQSNSNCEFIKELYKDYSIVEVGIFNPMSKKHVIEVFIKNY